MGVKSSLDAMGNEGNHKGCPYQSWAVPVGVPLVGALIATAKGTHQYKEFALLW